MQMAWGGRGGGRGGGGVSIYGDTQWHCSQTRAPSVEEVALTFCRLASCEHTMEATCHNTMTSHISLNTTPRDNLCHDIDSKNVAQIHQTKLQLVTFCSRRGARPATCLLVNIQRKTRQDKAGGGGRSCSILVDGSQIYWRSLSDSSHIQSCLSIILKIIKQQKISFRIEWRTHLAWKLQELANIAQSMLITTDTTWQPCLAAELYPLNITCP